MKCLPIKHQTILFNGECAPSTGLYRAALCFQVAAGIGPLCGIEKDPLQIADSMALVDLGSDEAGLLLTTAGLGPPLLLPPESMSGIFPTCKVVAVLENKLDCLAMIKAEEFPMIAPGEVADNGDCPLEGSSESSIDAPAIDQALQLFLTHVASAGIGIDFPKPDLSHSVSLNDHGSHKKKTRHLLLRVLLGVILGSFCINSAGNIFVDATISHQQQPTAIAHTSPAHPQPNISAHPKKGLALTSSWPSLPARRPAFSPQLLIADELCRARKPTCCGLSHLMGLSCRPPCCWLRRC